MKFCPRCGVIKDTAEFHHNATRVDGLASHCKACMSLACAAWYQQNKARVATNSQRWKENNPGRHKAYKRKYRYQLTEVRFDALLDEQGGDCALCLSPLDDDISIDHDHGCCPGEASCGQCVRGLLHKRCNRALGMFGDDPNLLRLALDYLTKVTVRK